MALIDELKERRDRQEEALDKIAEDIKEREEFRLRVERELDDLDRAIAALEAAVALEQLEKDHALPPSADDVVTDLQGDTVEEMREAFEDVFEAQAEPVEHISILTGDHAIEPESGLHGDPVPQTEGYAPVTNPDADFWARGLERDQKPQTYNPFNIFRREKEDA
jgi:hypothetical protein